MPDPTPDFSPEAIGAGADAPDALESRTFLVHVTVSAAPRFGEDAADELQDYLCAGEDDAMPPWLVSFDQIDQVTRDD